MCGQAGSGVNIICSWFSVFRESDFTETSITFKKNIFIFPRGVFVGRYVDYGIFIARVKFL